MLETKYPKCLYFNVYRQFKKITFVYALTDTRNYYNLKYSDTLVLTGPIKFLVGQGFISKDDKGKYLTHLHAQFSDEDMRVKVVII
ncbi:MAG: hypothetical protein ACERLG_06480 [Sedimentibacter sp.]